MSKSLDQLPEAAALASVDLFPVWQGGQTRKATAQQVLDGLLGVGTFLSASAVAAGVITPAPGALNFSGGATGDVLSKQADGSLALVTPSSGVNIAQYQFLARLIAGSGGATGVGQAELSEEGTPAAGHMLVGWGAGGVLKKFDVANIQTALLDNSVTNTKLADMPQATFKMRAAGAGTGDPIDGTAAQAKTALALVAADITDTISTGGITDNAITNAKLANMAEATVKVGPTVGTGDPEDVGAEDFRSRLGFGIMSTKESVSVSDLNATGTPGPSTFLRGDNTWSPVVPAAIYDVTDLDNAVTLTAAHSRYQISGGNLLVKQLRLRNSSDQAAPVRITVPDSDSITPEGVEFTFIQAPDQTGLCVIRGQTAGSINGLTPGAASPADAVWTGASGTTVTITSAGAGLPSVSAGAIFEVRNHSTAANNGFYRAIGSPTTSSITAVKQTGSAPANAGAEAVDIDTGFVALGGLRASAVLVVDSNSGAVPVCRLEGETFENRTIPGDMTFNNIAKFLDAADFDGPADFSGAAAFSGSGSLNMADLDVSRAHMVDTSWDYLDAGNKNGGVTFDFTAGMWQKCVLTGNVSSVTVSNWPPSGKVGSLTLEVHQDGTGNRTIAWGAAYRFPGGTDFIASTAAGAIDIWTLVTRDGGATVYAFEGGKAFAA